MKYKVKENNQVKHNGRLYGAGKVIEMDKEVGGALVDDGVLEEVKKEKKRKEEKKGKEEKKELESYTKKELQAMAEKAGVEFTTTTSKRKLIEKLQ